MPAAVRKFFLKNTNHKKFSQTSGQTRWPKLEQKEMPKIAATEKAIYYDNYSKCIYYMTFFFNLKQAASTAGESVQKRSQKSLYLFSGQDYIEIANYETSIHSPPTTFYCICSFH